MKLVSLRHSGSTSVGLVIEDQVLDLPGAARIVREAALVPASMRDLLEAGPAALDLLGRIRDQAARASASDALRECGALISWSAAKLAPPVPDPGVILCGGMNYHGHLKEMNTPVPKQPTAFFKNPSALAASGEPIRLPPEHGSMVDWEGEFSAVIGRHCFNVPAGEALDYVAGYTLINDVSARDWVAPVFQSSGIMGPIHAWEHNLLGKQFPTFCPCGPVLATRDEVPDPDDVALTTSLNGQPMQVANTSDLVFSIARLIEHFSRYMRFRPGDIVTTGSPAGVGYGRTPKLFMRAGDTIEVRVDAIGVLTNPVAGR